MTAGQRRADPFCIIIHTYRRRCSGLTTVVSYAHCPVRTPAPLYYNIHITSELHRGPRGDISPFLRALRHSFLNFFFTHTHKCAARPPSLVYRTVNAVVVAACARLLCIPCIYRCICFYRRMPISIIFIIYVRV